MTAVHPHALRPGATIGIVAPAGPNNEEKLQAGITYLQRRGYRSVVGTHVHDTYGYLAGTDIARAADINEMFDRDDIDAIICSRGGYGAMRLLPLLDYQEGQKSHCSVSSTGADNCIDIVSVKHLIDICRARDFGACQISIGITHMCSDDRPIPPTLQVGYTGLKLLLIIRASGSNDPNCSTGPEGVWMNCRHLPVQCLLSTYKSVQCLSASLLVCTTG